jgi:hypothetical protein
MLALFLQLRKSTENNSKSWRVVKEYLAVFWGIASAGLRSAISPYLRVGNFSQPSVNTIAYLVAEVGGHRISYISLKIRPRLLCSQSKIDFQNTFVFALL